MKLQTISTILYLIGRLVPCLLAANVGEAAVNCRPPTTTSRRTSGAISTLPHSTVAHSSSTSTFSQSFVTTAAGTTATTTTGSTSGTSTTSRTGPFETYILTAQGSGTDADGTQLYGSDEDMHEFLFNPPAIPSGFSVQTFVIDQATATVSDNNGTFVLCTTTAVGHDPAPIFNALPGECPSSSQGRTRVRCVSEYVNDYGHQLYCAAYVGNVVYDNVQISTGSNGHVLSLGSVVGAGNVHVVLTTN